MSQNQEQLQKIAGAKGFIAALDQSGGSTPKALKQYGVDENSWSGSDEMFDLVHEMRTRIITSPAFDGSRILGAILFENTMDRSIEGKPTGDFLWEEKGVVPFLKVDKGLAESANGVRLMNPMPNLGSLLERAKSKNMFGTKMRSLIERANEEGIRANVAQQFDIARTILDAGLVPIVEPEVDIHAPDKESAEAILKRAILDELETIDADRQVMLKLTLPEVDGLYSDVIAHPRVLRVVALSGGYSREEANARLSRQPGMVASFSRALAEGLSHQQSDDEFRATLDASIQAIYEASIT